MTHTLHRVVPEKDQGKDYVVLSMAARNYNDRGAAAKLVSNLKIMVGANPVNYGDDNYGGIYTGQNLESIIEMANDGAYMAAVYDDADKLEEALKKLKEADNGMSVVVSGNFKKVFAILKNIGLKPHTVNLSVGFLGNKEFTPENEILEISTMCGHGMVCQNHILKIIDQVKKKTNTPENGAGDLARSCTCAIFNPVRAANILSNLAREVEPDVNR